MVRNCSDLRISRTQGSAVQAVGRFATAGEAAEARDLAALLVWGETEALNFPLEYYHNAGRLQSRVGRQVCKAIDRWRQSRPLPQSVADGIAERLDRLAASKRA